MTRTALNRFEGDKATTEWLDSQKKSTKTLYKSSWRFFVEFTGLTGDQIIESRRADKGYFWEKKVIEFKRWLVEDKKKSENTAKTAVAMIRGFFSYHRLPLQFRRQESIQLKEAENKFEDYRFSRDDLKKMSEFADLAEKYIIAAGKSFGLRAGDFLALTRGDLEPYIERETPISIGQLKTRKEKTKAFPFIDSDAQPIIKLLLGQMDREGRTNANEPMLTYTDEIQLSRSLRRVAVKAGIKFSGKRIRFHCMRKFLIDRLSSFMSESKWKQIVGKKVSESAYVSPDSLREDYTRAMAETTFQTTQTEDIAKLAKKEALMALAKTMGIEEQELSGLFAKKPMRIEDQIKFLEERIQKIRQSDCANGANCGEFEQIPESKLLEHLRSGWVVQHKLANGDLIVKK